MAAQEQGASRRRAKARAELGKKGYEREMRMRASEAKAIAQVRQLRGREGVAITSPGRDAIEALRYHRKRKAAR